MNEVQPSPWYKQFYPWLLIAIPLSSIIVGMIVLRFATDGSNSLVVDDYYKEGKTINMRLEKIERAKALNMKSLLFIDADTVVLEFESGAPANGQALKLNFYHATLEHRDTEILLTRDAKGSYRASIDFDVRGKWRLRLTPLDDEWKIQASINLPQNSAFRFDPE